MNCHNCGAAMELIESRKYFVCRHCGSFSFPEPIDVDGIRIVGRPADAKACPVCSVPMDQAVIDERHSAHFCGKCRGILLPRDTFAGVIGHRRAWATGVPVPPPPFDPATLDRMLNCPICHERFTTHPYGGPGAVAIDTCERCNVIWLDYREMKQIVDAPGADRGNRDRPITSDDSVIVPMPTEDDMRTRTDPLDFILTLLSR